MTFLISQNCVHPPLLIHHHTPIFCLHAVSLVLPAYRHTSFYIIIFCESGYHEWCELGWWIVCVWNECRSAYRAIQLKIQLDLCQITEREKYGETFDLPFRFTYHTYDGVPVVIGQLEMARETQNVPVFSQIGSTFRSTTPRPLLVVLSIKEDPIHLIK